MTTSVKSIPSSPERPPPPPRSSNNKSSTRPKASSRWSLGVQANVWRFLEQVGAYLHNWPSPPPPSPSFIRTFTTAVLGTAETATIELAFYVPPNYPDQIRQGKRYPTLVNLHGGGFTLGSARDDARWAAFVLEEVGALFVSVEYRLAPEFPFPAAVEDGVEAVLHLAEMGDEYGIDPKRMALSGFSAGGNLAFTIPLRLQAHLQSIRNEVASKAFDRPVREPVLPEIVSIIAWYPSLDQRLSRAERRAACSRPDKTLPPFLTNLFDQAYLPSLDDKTSPYASPSAATDEALAMALPDNIAIYLCEWDMLIKEGKDFTERLRGLGKQVQCIVIEQKRHAFDKSPYPFSVDPKVIQHYQGACSILREVFKS
ncbi:MAG: hypothetical protein Q9217_006152 [Psora testacea]